MLTLLLAIIYAAFIGLGLPDSLLGAAWPNIHIEMNVPLSYAGLISMIIAGGTIISSLFADKITKRFGTGLVTAVSISMTSLALFGFSISNSFWMLCLWAIPYGFGAGAIDTALNNYVALHYASRHMSWLHCFWGVGAAISPYIMGYCLSGSIGWVGGYRTVSIMLFSISALLFFSLPLWKKQQEIPHNENAPPPLAFKQLIRVRGVPQVLISLFAYCVVETTAGLWASSYLVINRGISPETAAEYAALFYLGITFGRFLSGFVADKVGDKNMVRIGITICILGIVAVWLPLKTNTVALYGLLVIGFGGAPIFPAIIHSTPRVFGAENSQAMVGLQLASAYAGCTFMPPVFGLIANYISIIYFPAFMILFAIAAVFSTESLNRLVAADAN